MGQRAPRSFLVFLFFGLMLSCLFSLYMEDRHLDWLGRHPIAVNLISGVVGFCGGFLTLAIVYNWFVDRDRFLHLTRTDWERWCASVREVRIYSKILHVISPHVVESLKRGEEALTIPGQRLTSRLAAASGTLPFPRTYAEYNDYASSFLAMIDRHHVALTEPYADDLESSRITENNRKMERLGWNIVNRARRYASGKVQPTPELIGQLGKDVEALADLTYRAGRAVARRQVIRERHKRLSRD